MIYQEVTGDLITLAKAGKFDVVAHGCNCFNKMGRGLAPQMATAFGADKFKLESPEYYGDINKLGQIDYQVVDKVVVVNCYTQYEPGKNLDYPALELCLYKMDNQFAGRMIGLPLIGCGIAGGNWIKVRNMIKVILLNCNVTVVTLPGQPIRESF